MTTTKATQRNGSNSELPEDHPLKAQDATTAPTPPQSEPNWQGEAMRLDSEVKFWRMKYFEALQFSQSQAQVIATLARPQVEQDARQQAEILARFTGMQANR